MHSLQAVPLLPLDSTERWYQSATVRHSPRILLTAKTGSDELFPRSRQMLADHPMVVAKGADAVSYVLAQSAYRHMHEVAFLETKLVIECSVKISNSEIMPEATDADRLDALTVVVDEAYHAHVALDFVDQVKRQSGIPQLQVPADNAHLEALRKTRDALPEHLRPDFELIAVCVAEHILIKDIATARREAKLAPAFTQLMSDHSSDEGRHATFFSDLTRRCWARMSDADRQAIGAVLPAFIRSYTAGDRGREFDRAVLTGCGLAPTTVEAVIEDTDPMYQEITELHVEMTRSHLMKLLRRTGILEHAPTFTAFVASGMLAI